MFLEGLNDDIQFQLLNADYVDFQHMVDKAIVIESKLKEMERDDKRKMPFPRLSSRSNVRPHFSSGLSAHMAQPAIFFLLRHRSRARKPPPPTGLGPPPWSAPTTSTGEKITTASLLLHFPIKLCPSPYSIPGNRCLQSGGIEAPSTPANEGTRPPLPRLCPIKGHPALGEDPHTSSAPSLSPHQALAAALLSRGSATDETPLHRLPTRGDPIVELACPSFPSPAPWLELSGTGAAGGP
jgi:hypothetical protein